MDMRNIVQHTNEYYRQNKIFQLEKGLKSWLACTIFYREWLSATWIFESWEHHCLSQMLDHVDQHSLKALLSAINPIKSDGNGLPGIVLKIKLVCFNPLAHIETLQKMFQECWILEKSWQDVNCDKKHPSLVIKTQKYLQWLLIINFICMRFGPKSI